MKKILFCIALAIAAVACDTQPDATLPGAIKPPVLNILTPEATIETEGGNATVTFLSTKEWTARIVKSNSSSKEEWCWIDTSSGEGDEENPLSITIRADANPTYENRTATLYITSANYNKTAKITQKQLDVINVNQPQYNVLAKGETINIDIMSNVICDVHIGEGVDWVKRIDNVSSSATRAYAAKGFRFEVSPNTTGAERQTEIKFVYKELSKSVTIIQAGEDEE